ncbi:MAG: DNA translocase FtsK 4TM domain-containing protein [Cellulosilyticaceae bacterium]
MKKKKRPGSNTKKKQSVKGETLVEEVVGIGAIGAALLMLASILFTDQVGVVGVMIRYIFIGTFGIGGYILPFYIIFLGILYIKGEFQKIWISMTYMLPLMLMLMTLFHMIQYGNFKNFSLLSLTYFERAAWYNGGWLGAVLGYGSLTLFGSIGTYILLIVLLGIWVMVTTKFPALSLLGGAILTLSQRVSQFVKETQIQLKLGREEARAKKVKERIAQKTKEKEQAFEHPPIYFDHAINEETGEVIEAPQVSVAAPEVAVTTWQEEVSVPMKQEIVSEEEKKPVTKAKQTPIMPEIQNDINDMAYEFPPIALLRKNEQTSQNRNASKASLNNAQKLEATLASFGVEAKVLQIHRGPTVTRYELQPKQGVKVSKIVNLADDIALNLAASGIRIEAPIPGKSAVGIEVPNEASEMVYLRDVIESDNFAAYPSKLAFALGKDIAGKPIVTDIAKMPHMLIAGATGSGKSVCINTLITSILYKAKPSEVKLIMIDPKVVELNVYNGIPHLMIPVVTDPRKAAGALCWAVNEMTKRYNLFAENNVRDMKGYNLKVQEETEKMPHIVIIIDELADLMMTAAKEVEDAICRLAQMARAAGIHLVIATQRPSVDVITGVIKANIPSRLAFAVSSGIDSRTILDMNGAEKLLGKGDMLFNPIGESKPIRIQGAFVSDQEVEAIVEAVKQTGGHATYEEDVIQSIDTPTSVAIEGSDEDELIPQAINLAKGKDKLSISMLQRYFRVGFNRASRLMDALEARGIVGPDEGSKPRKVLVNTTAEEREYD